MFEVKTHWLDEFSRNGKTGWNAKQLAVLGVRYPLRSGWKERLIGAQISDAQKREFEALAGHSREGMKVDRGLANMRSNPVYRTFADGQGGWAGAWMGEARFPWCKDLA